METFKTLYKLFKVDAREVNTPDHLQTHVLWWNLQHMPRAVTLDITLATLSVMCVNNHNNNNNQLYLISDLE